MMQALTLIAISFAGGLGALCRFACDTLLGRRVHASLVTLLVNLSGSLLAGAVAGTSVHMLQHPIAPILATGFLGGYTTLSTASVQAVQAALERKWNEALLVGGAQIIACVVAAAIGFGLARLILT